MIAHFALDFMSTGAPMLVFDARQSLLKLAQPIFGSLGRRAVDDHPTHERFLIRDALLSFAPVRIGWRQVMRSRHESLQTPVS